MSRFLLDTNVASEPLRPQPNSRLLAKLRQYGGQLAIASVTWHEMRFGCARLPTSRRREMVELYLRESAQSFEILPYDEEAAEWHAYERARLTALGRTPPFVDGQIAAIAKINGLVLITSNRSDFEGFEGLTIDDWRG